MVRFTEIIALNSAQKEEEGWGGKVLENCWNQALYILGKRPFDIERVVQKGTFVILLKRAGNLIPQGPPWVCPRSFQ